MVVNPVRGWFDAPTSWGEGKAQWDLTIAALLDSAVHSPAAQVTLSGAGEAVVAAGVVAIDGYLGADEDTLSTISLDLPEGRVVLIMPQAGKAITVEHGVVGNGGIDLHGQVDAMLAATTQALMVQRVGDRWREIRLRSAGNMLPGELLTAGEPISGVRPANGVIFITEEANAGLDGAQRAALADWLVVQIPPAAASPLRIAYLVDASVDAATTSLAVPGIDLASLAAGDRILFATVSSRDGGSGSANGFTPEDGDLVVGSWSPISYGSGPTYADAQYDAGAGDPREVRVQLSYVPVTSVAASGTKNGAVAWSSTAWQAMAIAFVTEGGWSVVGGDYAQMSGGVVTLQATPNPGITFTDEDVAVFVVGRGGGAASVTLSAPEGFSSFQRIHGLNCTIRAGFDTDGDPGREFVITPSSTNASVAGFVAVLRKVA
jgi:hypothetical protein